MARKAGSDGEKTEAAIREAGARLIAHHGYEAVSLRQLASDCDVSDSLLSHHFGTKRQLWYEAADSAFAPLLGRLVATLEGINAPNAAWTLRLNLKASLMLLAAEPDAVAFLFREGEGQNERDEHLRTHYLHPYTQRINALADEAQAAGLMRPMSHEACTGMVLGIMRMIVIPGLYKHDLAPRLATPESTSAYVDEIVTIFYDGLMSAPSPAS